MKNSDNLLKGKKLLILGGAPNEIPIIKRAQSFGVYVIVSDMYLDHNVSPGKDAADEYWDISWSDVDSLVEKCIECGVNGVLGGFSEIKIDSLIQLCSRLGFPCYANQDQLAITRNKLLFKRECSKYNVPTIKEYIDKDDVDEYPVIVKPVDRAGSIGVGIAWNKEELDKAYEIAVEKSLSGKVIIEKFIIDSTEIDAHYAISGGNISLLVLDDIIQAKGNREDGKVVQSAWMYPSRYLRSFLSSVDSKLREMIYGMGIKDGTIFFSGFASKEGKFSFFECGFRLWGEQEFRYDYLQNGIYYLDLYIYHALLGSTECIPKNTELITDLKGVAINLYVKGGVIGVIDGLDEIQNHKDCTLSIQYGYVGRSCSFDNSILTNAGLIGFANRDPYNLKKDIELLYQTVTIEDQDGLDMIYDHVDSDLALEWWGRDGIEQ